MPGTIETRIDGAVATLVFSHAERRNALTLAMWQAIPEAIAKIDTDPTIRVIVLEGAGGKAFVSGSDVSEFDAGRSEEEQRRAYLATTDRALDALRSASKPLVAVIRGYCVGGGISVALCCDLRIANSSAVFIMPAAKVGLAYYLRDLKPIVDALGIMRTKDIFFTGRRIGGEEALRLGLVTSVIADEDIARHANALCTEIAEKAPLTLKAVKGICRELEKPPDVVDTSLCDQLADACFSSEDYAEGRRAFGEKRRPTFKGM